MRSRSTILLISVLAVLASVVVGVAQAGPALTYVKAYQDQTHQIMIDGEVFWAVPVDRAAKLREAEKLLPGTESDLKACSAALIKTQGDLQTSKNTLQEERVRAASINKRFDENQANLTECFKALNHGGGKLGKFLDNPVVDLGIKIGQTTAQLATCR